MSFQNPIFWNSITFAGVLKQPITQLKNKFLIEKFSGRTVLSVYQDFFAAMFLFNCVSAISFTLNRKFTRLKRNCRYHYRANHNLIVACLKFRLPAILLGKYTSFQKPAKNYFYFVCVSPFLSNLIVLFSVLFVLISGKLLLLNILFDFLKLLALIPRYLFASCHSLKKSC